MSDPLRDYSARKRQERKELVQESYTPIVIWVQSDIRSQKIINYLHGEVESLPGVMVATDDAPYRYATGGVLREEEADGNTNYTKTNDE